MKKKIVCALLSFIASCFIFAGGNSNPLKFDLSADFAYHPHADFIAGGNHYAHMTGIYESLEARVIGNMNYIIPTPLGEHWLLKDANVKLQANCELTPITVKPGIHAEFTPLPFLVFSTGAQIGTGWGLFGLVGVGKYNGVNEYNVCNGFSECFLKWYAQATFQFDAEALWPGDWHHIQLMYSYQVYYEGLASASKGDLWMWQGLANKANGICNYQNLILAYQMPIVLSRAGIMFELNGHYDAGDYKGHENYKGDFMEFGISPLCQFTFTDKDMLTVMVNFKTRRSFKESHDSSKVEPNLTYDGYEWFLNRIVFSYAHKF